MASHGTHNPAKWVRFPHSLPILRYDMIKLAIVGSRSFNDYEKMCKTLDRLKFHVVVSGGAGGADSLAERYAEEHGLGTIIHKADWDKYGKSAGYIRNKRIVEDCHAMIAFWDGESRGTKHSIDLAKQAGKVVKIIRR